jgi:hypothetical protein
LYPRHHIIFDVLRFLGAIRSYKVTHVIFGPFLLLLQFLLATAALLTVAAFSIGGLLILNKRKRLYPLDLLFRVDPFLL